jgi:hypothetical protein
MWETIARPQSAPCQAVHPDTWAPCKYVGVKNIIDMPRQLILLLSTQNVKVPVTVAVDAN